MKPSSPGQLAYVNEPWSVQRDLWGLTNRWQGINSRDKVCLMVLSCALIVYRNFILCSLALFFRIIRFTSSSCYFVPGKAIHLLSWTCLFDNLGNILFPYVDLTVFAKDKLEMALGLGFNTPSLPSFLFPDNHSDLCHLPLQYTSGGSHAVDHTLLLCYFSLHWHMEFFFNQ